MLDLIYFGQSDDIPERFFWKNVIFKKKSDDKKAFKITQDAKAGVPMMA